LDKEMVLDLARHLGVPVTPEEAEKIAPNLALTRASLERMKELPLEGVEPPQWFLADRLR
jgi:Asp-tRNA(Asn)/Glu-tRNA(Gln) amidotransferase C subunit